WAGAGSTCHQELGFADGQHCGIRSPRSRPSCSSAMRRGSPGPPRSARVFWCRRGLRPERVRCFRPVANRASRKNQKAGVRLHLDALEPVLDKEISEVALLPRTMNAGHLRLPALRSLDRLASSIEDDAGSDTDQEAYDS